MPCVVQCPMSLSMESPADGRERAKCMDPRLVAECHDSAVSVLGPRRGGSVVAGVCRCAAAKQKKGCAQCAHPRCRTQPYRGRTGPYSACFREFLVFPGPGTRFESHLGHSVSAGQRPVSSLSVDKTAQSVDSGVPFSVWPAFENAPKRTDQRPIWCCGGAGRAASSRVCPSTLSSKLKL
jgi:hypothetical protein